MQRFLTLFVMLLVVITVAGAQTAPTYQILHQFQGPPADGYFPKGPLIITPHGLYGLTGDGGTSGFGTAFSMRPPGVAGGAWTERVIYDFLIDLVGNSPVSLVSAPGGVLYGETAAGNGDEGSVFSLTPPAAPGTGWTADPIYPYTLGGIVIYGSPLIPAAGGVLYGTSVALCNSSGEGCVFSLTPPGNTGTPWTASVLYSFTGGADGGSPGQLLTAPGGGFYGSAEGGSTACIRGCGVVFSLAPPTGSGLWTENVLYSFSGGADGSIPSISLGSNGVIYGTTTTGGSTNQGTIFSLTPPVPPSSSWTYTLLYSFNSPQIGTHSVEPSQLLVGANGALYGETLLGGKHGAGTVFVLVPPSSPGGSWTAKTLHVFAADGQGARPTGGLVRDASGVLYGVTEFGGLTLNSCSESSCGTVFSIKP